MGVVVGVEELVGNMFVEIFLFLSVNFIVFMVLLKVVDVLAFILDNCVN